MTTYRGYEEEERRQAAERAAAPQKCPHCGAQINENLGRWDKVRYHCGSDKCRKAASRANIAERKRQDRAQARARMLHYCEQQLDQDQRRAVMEMVDLTMAYDAENGHNIALAVVKVIEVKRCKHDRIAQLEHNAVLWQRRAESSERQLKERIAELEAELDLFTTLQNTIHGIATDQLRKQPDPQERPAPVQQEPEPEDEDRRAVLATLAAAGIKPIDQALAEEQGEDEDDDTEDHEGGEEYDGDEDE